MVVLSAYVLMVGVEMVTHSVQVKAQVLNAVITIKIKIAVSINPRGSALKKNIHHAGVFFTVEGAFFLQMSLDSVGGSEFLHGVLRVHKYVG